MKKLLILLFTLVFTSATFAEKVTKQQALEKAQKFFKDKRIESRNLSRGSKAGLEQSETQQDFYIFNAENKGGFVIISGDDRTPEVLGYSDKGYIDVDSIPSHLKAWLDGYAKQIAQIPSTVKNYARGTRSNHPAIQPLLTTKWGQDAPYNMNCPDFFDSGYKCVTGCVATAMAQVMYYHRAKSTNKTTTKIPGYYGSTHWQNNHSQLIINEIPEGSIIDWDNMLDFYGGSETDIQKEAVANLMLYCGTAVKMDYGFSESGAYTYDVTYALKQYFDYSEHTTLVYRQDYNEVSWDDLIYSELRNGNPLLYSGNSRNKCIVSGHAFVCDGYDGNGYYHINWGWDGLSDSFFLLSTLNPDLLGTGGGASSYNEGQCAMIGAVPNGEIVRLTSQNVSLTGGSSFSISGMDDNITLPLRWNVKNQTGTSHNFDHAIGLYKNGEFIKVLEETGALVSFAIDEEVIVDASLNIETNLAAGVYQLYALSRTHGDDKWFRNENSSCCFVTLVVKDDFMSFYVGKPVATEIVINFADDEVKRLCVENWDTDGDGEISYEEAASVTDFGYVFDGSIIRTFDEAQFFTGITSFGLSSGCEGGCSSLISIKIPSSSISIRDGAFAACKALTSIEIPASVKEIGMNAFQACFSLQEIVLHDGLEKINDKAFFNCFALSSINIPASVTFLGDNLWYYCTSLNDFNINASNPYYCVIDGVLFSKDQKTLIYYPVKRKGVYNIPEGTEAINSYAFSSSNLENVVLPVSLTSLGDCAFAYMENLKEYTIPSTVTIIGKGVFMHSNIIKAVLEGSRTTIPEDMFLKCWSLKNIRIPDDVTSIGSYAFFECSCLKEITIPAKVSSIGNYAFSLSSLKKITSLMQPPCDINSTVFENISSDAILYVPSESVNAYKETDYWKDFTQILSIGDSGTEAYVELLNGVLSFYYDDKREERNGTTYDYYDCSSWLENSNAIIKVVFDTSFAEVRPTSTNNWFHGCSQLTEIQGVENLNTIDVTDMNGMFQGCSSLTSIDLSSFNTDNLTSMYAMFWYCSNLKTVVLPSDLAFIDSWQFVYCGSLADITIPESITSIGENAFACCYALTGITIPSNVKSILSSAFAYCSSLSEITIPSKVTFIGDNAFLNSGLTKVTSLMQTPCAITSTVFENVSSNATLYVPKGCKAAYEAANYWKDFMLIVDYLPGDANGDSELSEADRNYITRHIMGDTPDDFDEEAADLNNDKKVNVADIVLLNKLLQ